MNSELLKIIEETPNNYDLGEKVRIFYDNHKDELIEDELALIEGLKNEIEYLHERLIEAKNKH